MDGETTSRAVARAEPSAGASAGPSAWGQWVRFVLRPRLPAERVRFGWAAIGEVGWLLLLYLLITLPLAAGLSWLAGRTGVQTPVFEELARRGPAFTLLVGALVLPVGEEIAFRAWLDGRGRHFAFFGALVGIMLSVIAAVHFIGGGAALAGSVAVASFGWVMLGWWLGRRWGSGVPLWFARGFPGLYFGSALLFGLAHMSNYALDRPLLLLPFVLPQTLGGLLFGYARVRHGMWANIALHSTSNAIFLGLSMNGF